jgi:sialate O-acetylesterase
MFPNLPFPLPFLRAALCVLFFVQISFSTTSLAGELSLPAIFSDHAVLQRGHDIPIWGKAAAGAEVVVSLGDARTTSKADGQGKWMAKLDLSKAGLGPLRMVVRSGSDEVAVEDVLVGEVWLASGQSNMVRTLGKSLGADEEIPKSANPSLRGFLVSAADADQPKEDLKGEWMVASPETSGRFSAVAYHFGKTIQETMKVPVGLIISAVGSTTVETWTSRESLDTVPTLAAAAEKVRQHAAGYPEAKAAYQPALKNWLEQTGRADRRKAAPEQLLAGESIGWETLEMPLTPSDHAQPGAVWLRTTVEVPAEQAEKTTFLQLGRVHGFDEIYWNGQKIGATATDEALPMIRRDYFMTVRREVVREGANDLAIRLYFPTATPFIEVARDQFRLRNGIPLAGKWRQHREYTLPALSESEVASEPSRPQPPPSPAKSYSKYFNAMMHPLVPYGLAGVIWYQGEANATRGEDYRTAFPLLIEDWRKLWNRNDLPFYWVQLPGHYAKPTKPQSDSDWAALREAQTMTLAVPFTGQAVTLDLGEAEDIHPTEKAPVGRRLAAVALAKTYGQAVPFQGPVFESARFEEAKAVLSFSDIAGGLFAQVIPEKHALSKIPPRYAPLVRNSPNSELEGFELAGEDGVWHWADARINDSQVVVSSAAVPLPRAVRYAWADNPTANLWGKNGFPAGPFRTEASFTSAPSPTPKKIPTPEPQEP